MKPNSIKLLTNPDASAFGIPDVAQPHNSELLQGELGLTKREYFAVMVLQGIAREFTDDPSNDAPAALYAVTFADALIAALNGEIKDASED